jgi:spore coat polysaccharide biosynthesis protein SpsF (cytidylyltransferase family)
MIIEEIDINGLAFIIQARMGSTRFPQKMLLPFHENLSIFDVIINKIKINFSNIPIIIATSINEENDIIEKNAKLLNCKVYRGDENDVLKRIYEAALKNRVTRIIRVCADNPFLDVLELKKLVLYVNNKNLDYASFEIDGIPSIKTHFGFWAEYVSIDALKKVIDLTQELIYHEHVTNYIYENRDLFKTDFIEPNPNVSKQVDIRMTLDTKKDFIILSQIYHDLNLQYGIDFGIDEILKYLSNNIQFKKLMNLEIIDNLKS